MFFLIMVSPYLRRSGVRKSGDAVLRRRADRAAHVAEESMHGLAVSFAKLVHALVLRRRSCGNGNCEIVVTVHS
jgi:hypothetical protein